MKKNVACKRFYRPILLKLHVQLRRSLRMVSAWFGSFKKTLFNETPNWEKFSKWALAQKLSRVNYCEKKRKKGSGFAEQTRSRNLLVVFWEFKVFLMGIGVKWRRNDGNTFSLFSCLTVFCLCENRVKYFQKNNGTAFSVFIEC